MVKFGKFAGEIDCHLVVFVHYMKWKMCNKNQNICWQKNRRQYEMV